MFEMTIETDVNIYKISVQDETELIRMIKKYRDKKITILSIVNKWHKGE